MGGTTLLVALAMLLTDFGPPPDTRAGQLPGPATVRGQSGDSLSIPTLESLQQSGENALRSVTDQASAGVSDATRQVQQGITDSINTTTQGAVDRVKQEAARLLGTSPTANVPTVGFPASGNAPSTSPPGTSFLSSPNPASTASPRVAPPPSSSSAPPTSSFSAQSSAVPQGPSTTYSPTPGLPNSYYPSSPQNSTSIPSTSIPSTSIPSTSIPQGASTRPSTSAASQIPMRPSTMPPATTSAGNLGNTSSGTVYPPIPPSLSTTAAPIPSSMPNSYSDYWSLDRVLTKAEQEERDARLLNEVGIGPGEVFIELLTQTPLSKTDPRYNAMSDYMNRFYEFKRASLSGSRPQATSIATSQPSGYRDPNPNLNTPAPTYGVGVNPYFTGPSSTGELGSNQLSTAAFDELVRRRAEEMLHTSNIRLAQNGSLNTGGLNPGGSLGFPLPGQTTLPTTKPVPGLENTVQTTTSPASSSTLSTAADARPTTTKDGKERRVYEPQALINFFLLLSIVGNVYLGIAISRLIRRYRNLVAVNRGTVVTS